MEYQRIYAYETYKIHYFCKQTAHKGCLLLNIPYICPCYKCSGHILGKRLAFSIMVNLDNSFNVWKNKDVLPLVCYICISLHIRPKV